jgi:hypothetical protein
MIECEDLRITRSDVAGGNYYYFFWRHTIINKLRAACVINRNNKLRFGETRRDAIPTVNFGEGTPPLYKGLSSTDRRKEFREDYDFSDELEARRRQSTEIESLFLRSQR